MRKKRKQKREKTELTIESIGFNGIAVARHDDIVYFVKGAVPGDRVIAEIKRKKKKHIEAEAVEILEHSIDRVLPLCKYFGTCGGCTWQHLRYEEQLKWKRRHVKDAFERIGKILPENIPETIPSPQIFNYRNKMDFSFGASRWLTKEEIQNEENIGQKQFALGLHIPGRYDKILDIDSCQIQMEEGNEILNLFREKALESGVTAFNEKTHEGFLRNLVLRMSPVEKEMMCILVTNSPSAKEDEDYLEWYRKDFPKLFPMAVSIIHAVNPEIKPVAIGEINFVEGKDFIRDSILGITYRISPFSFFQTNSWQLDVFISRIIEFAGLSGAETLWDMYCGTGSIALPASKRVKKVFGFELAESSIDDARQNAVLNEIENVHFKALDLHSKEISSVLEQYDKPDVMIIDPPRAGMHKNLLKYILNAFPEKIVYVSCNPATQARDCEALSEKYHIKKVQPVDMFPHTFHIESIARLEKK